MICGKGEKIVGDELNVWEIEIQKEMSSFLNTDMQKVVTMQPLVEIFSGCGLLNLWKLFAAKLLRKYLLMFKKRLNQLVFF